MPHLPAPASTPVFGTRLPPPTGARYDDCCRSKALPTPALPVARRAKLADLDPPIHCSIIGTCLTTAELRRLVPRHVPLLDRQHATDLQIHHAAVELSTHGGAAAKELNKALDARHALAIKKFRAANDEHDLTVLWQDALASGDVPGAYWALMTHPASTFDVRTLAFGDVHMLSHLVGAANRADIRRLVVLEQHCARLEDQGARQQHRLHEMSERHRAALQQAQRQAQALTTQPAAPSGAAADGAALAAAEQALALQKERCHAAEQRWERERERSAALESAVQQSRQAAAALEAELAALERACLQGLDATGGQPALPPLHGKCIVYVGGRPGATSVLERLVRAAGGELLVHDGGIEDRRGLLAALLPRADLVVFPVDCISHNAMHVARQTCARHGVACHPLRSASVASCVELLQRQC